MKNVTNSNKLLEKKTELGKFIAPVKFTLGESEIGLLFNHKQFVKVLTAGKHNLSRLGKDYTLKISDIAQQKGLQNNAEIIRLAKKHSDAFVGVLQLIETTDKSIAFISQKGVIVDVLMPARDAYVWQDSDDYHVEMITIDNMQVVDEELLQRLRQSPAVLKRLVAEKVLSTATLLEHQIGMMSVDDRFEAVLSAGEYAWWTLGSSVKIEAVDMRLQNMEISGQETLTQDRVSIRLNLLLTWQVEDAEKLVLNVKNYSDLFYREMQLALRTVVATKALDELLADKNLLNSEVKSIVEPIAEAQGISVQSVGVKDVILPGEMKDILSKVVEAQKTAEANIIKRREETPATRSLHNTAKVMENKPVLLRLKELESLEKITSQISELNVYGGMDGLMNGLVDLRTEKKT